jgi:hypothetical protein
LTYSWVGQTGYEALQGGARLPLLLALGALAVLSLLPVLIKKNPRLGSG